MGKTHRRPADLLTHRHGLGLYLVLSWERGDEILAGRAAMPLPERRLTVWRECPNDGCENVMQGYDKWDLAQRMAGHLERCKWSAR